MVSSNQISAGMIITVSKKLYRVESSVKVTVAKGSSFIKTKLRDMATNKVIEKNFKPGQSVEEVTLVDRPVEFLYLEGKDYLFLDVATLDQVLIPQAIVGEKDKYLKEGVELTASFCGDKVMAIELPQFLELMVAQTEDDGEQAILTESGKMAMLETGAQLEVPPFIEAGDIIKVDTQSGDYIQRV
ncbi:MAG: elongation factor P [Chlamydiales bacterium]|nr:elongation factor P [Chlamydiia bacterium]MCP5507211.1 elongation factor P [Chlamydiales bacterium]